MQTQRLGVYFVVIIALLPLVSIFGATDREAAMITKAEDILKSTEVVSSDAIGVAGECPEANWALSVIITHDPKPVERLTKLAGKSSPAGFFMCLLGIRIVDHSAFDEYVSSHRIDSKNLGHQIQIQVGCIRSQVTAEDALKEIGKFPFDSIIRDPIPELSETIRARKIDFGIPPQKTRNVK